MCCSRAVHVLFTRCSYVAGYATNKLLNISQNDAETAAKKIKGMNLLFRCSFMLPYSFIIDLTILPRLIFTVFCLLTSAQYFEVFFSTFLCPFRLDCDLKY